MFGSLHHRTAILGSAILVLSAASLGAQAANAKGKAKATTAGHFKVSAPDLTAKGRIIAPLRVWRRAPDDFLLLTEPSLGEVVRTTLVRARFAAKCEIEPEEHTSLVVFGVAEGLPGEIPGTVEVLDSDLEVTLEEDELEQARIEAARRIKFLVVVAAPSIADESQYPSRPYVIITAAIVFLALYFIGALVFSIIREQS